jgi:hypothetical protein
MRFGEREASDPLPARHPRQVLPLLFLAPERDDAGRADPGMVADQRRKSVVGLAHLLLDCAFPGEIEADAAVLLGYGQTEESELARLVNKVVGNRIVFLDPARLRLDFLREKAPDLGAQCLHFSRWVHGC